MRNGRTSTTPGRERLDAGSRAVAFINNLTLSNDFKGQPFRLRPWQESIVRRIFGTLDADGLRQYQEVFIFLPRKQAKTQLCAAMGVYALLGMGTIGEEIVCAAGSTDQASILYEKAVEMIEADPWLDRQVRVYAAKKKIVARKTGNVLKVVSADGKLQHGLNPSVLLFDELHTQPNHRLYEALTSAQSTRANFLNIFITTAGNQFDSLCYEEYQRAKRAEADPAKYPNYLPVIYEAGPEDDWTDERTWAKAMPALGDFARLKYFRDKLVKALESPALESTFRQLYLNQWVASEAKWLNSPRWDQCGDVEYDDDDLLGLPCYVGLDLSQTDDLTALVAVFPLPDETFRLLCRFWMPVAIANQRDRSTGNRRFKAWAKAGILTLTPGDTIDYDWIKAEIKRIAKHYKVQIVRIDPFSGTQIAIQLRDEFGLDVEFMRQKPMDMNESVRFADYLIKKNRLHHGANPCLTWQAQNAVSVKDSEGNMKLSKSKSADKIDGMVALVMGLAAKITSVPETDNSFIKL